MGRLPLRDAERRGVANGDVERSRRAISDALYESLLSTCEGVTNRVLLDDGAKWILKGSEQEQRHRTAGVKILCSMLVCGRAKEIVKQGLSDRSGMIAFGRIRERFGKIAEVTKLSDVFQFQWTSSDSLEGK